jgi:hypothetical protein
MRTLTCLSAMTAALAAGLGLQGCGGTSASSPGDDRGGAAGTGGMASGGKTTTGGTANAGSATAGETTGGATTGGATTGGATTAGTATGGNATGGTTTGGAPNFPCKNPMPVLDANGKPTGLETCEKGGNHRTEPTECAVKLPRAEVCQASGAGTNTCAKDDDCTAKLYGTCGKVGQIGNCECGYGCRTDADCGNGGVCVCGGSVGYCQAATCRSDDDCVPGYQCRAFQDPTATICDLLRFECQMPADTCESNAGCPASQYCVADAKGEHHCQAFSCGIPGRPFLIDGCAVTAHVLERCDWLDEGAPAFDDLALTPAAREALAAHYTRAAQLEHASIAAFARFTLQLLELGAPAELVAGSQRALADELEHAKACFGLASRFAGRALGPAGLPIAGCLEQTALADVLRLAVREGCIGETVAAVQASEAYAHASDPGVRRALFDIQRDEARHAELAFRFVRWALESDPSLRAIVEDELERAQRGISELQSADTIPDPQRVACGLLPAAHLAPLERRTVDDVVASLLRELVAVTTARAA